MFSLSFLLLGSLSRERRELAAVQARKETSTARRGKAEKEIVAVDVVVVVVVDPQPQKKTPHFISLSLVFFPLSI